MQGRERDRLQEKRIVNRSENEESMSEKPSLSWLDACESPCKMDWYIHKQETGKR